MPPVIPRKRLRSDSPAPESPSKRATRNAPSRRGKESVFQTLDTPPTMSRSRSKMKALLEQEDDSSEPSDAESSEEEFEDVIINGTTQATSSTRKRRKNAREEESSAGEEWEDALGGHHTTHENEPAPVISGDIELTLSAHPTQTAFSSKPDGKKGPSKIQRQIRNVTHCMHVQFLMFHNLIRNGWIQDQQLQKTLVEHMTTGSWQEMERYWRDAGIPNGARRVVKGGWTKTIERELGRQAKWKDTGSSGVQEYTGAKPKGAAKASSSKGKGKDTRASDRNQRDWGATSDRLEPNTPNLSAGDPLLRLLRYLSGFWKSKFKVVAPSLRKRGYLSPSTLEAEIAAWREDPTAADTFGERVENLEAFRELARTCRGSRDVGQQFFTALLRGLGIEARMIASLQPVGIGWSQAEEGKGRNLEKLKDRAKFKGADVPNIATPAKLGKRTQIVNGSSGSLIDLSGEESSDLSSVISISSDSELDSKPLKKTSKVRKYGDELPYPTYWTEAISHLTHTPVCISPFPRTVVATSSTPDALLTFYCRGAAADKAKQAFAYLIAFSSDGTAKDVTTRYLPRRQWPGKTKGFRMPAEKIPIHNKRGKVKRWEEWDWFKSVLRPYARDISTRQPWDEIEDEGDLVPKKPEKPKGMDEDGGKETLQGYKNSAEYVLERHLRREEALKPAAKIVRYFTTGKGDTEKKEPVYLRIDIVSCKTVESWHKEGRAVKEGEQPLKYVPMRAITVTRKREIEERERVEGEKIKQGLYSKAQTDWIIPDPIQDGEIPRNAFGNIDVYVATMVPKGAIHIPLKGTARICKKLGVDFAEACTGFEFGMQRAVPVLTGVVVAIENEDLVIDAWEADQAEKAKKEQAKRETLVLGMWKKFYVGLRIVDRMKKEYGEEVELPANEASRTSAPPKKSERETFQNHGNDFEGGFIRDEANHSHQNAGGFIQDDEHTAGGFVHSSQEDHPHHNGALTIDHDDDDAPDQTNTTIANSYRTPISLHSATQKPADREIVEDEEDDGKDEKPAIRIPQARMMSRPRGKSESFQGQGRGGRRRPTVRRKSPNEDEDDGASSLSALSSSSLESNDESFTSERHTKRKAASPPSSTRAVPKRNAARKSESKVKSQFFAHGSDEDTDLSPQKKGGTGGRGRGKGRVRGRKA